MNNDNSDHTWTKTYKWFHKCYECGCLMIVPDLGKVTYHPAGSNESTIEEPKCIKITDHEQR